MARPGCTRHFLCCLDLWGKQATCLIHFNRKKQKHHKGQKAAAAVPAAACLALSLSPSVLLYVCHSDSDSAISRAGFEALCACALFPAGLWACFSQNWKSYFAIYLPTCHIFYALYALRLFTFARWRRPLRRSSCRHIWRSPIHKLETWYDSFVQIFKLACALLWRRSLCWMCMVSNSNFIGYLLSLNSIHNPTARDVVKYLVDMHITSIQDFDWISQLRYYWKVNESE